jgi:hypothetical protein
MAIVHFGFFGSFSFRFPYFASFVFVSLMISSFSLRSETSEKTAFFRIEAKSFSLHFRFVSLRTENERRTLILLSYSLEPESSVRPESDFQLRI